MQRNVSVKEGGIGRFVAGLQQVRVPAEGGLVVALGGGQRNVMLLAEAHGEYARRLYMVAEPVGTRDVRVVRIDTYHYISIVQDVHNGGDAYRGQIQRIDGFQLHADAETVVAVFQRAHLKRRE